MRTRTGLLPGLARAGGIGVASALVAAACTGGGSEGSAAPGSIEVRGEVVPAAELTGVAAGLCVARDQARARPEAAQTTFLDRSHGRLHTIAAALEGVDRSAAARLLVAKQAVEADLSAKPFSSQLPADLDRLAALTRAGLAKLGLSAPACKDDGSMNRE